MSSKLLRLAAYKPAGLLELSYGSDQTIVMIDLGPAAAGERFRVWDGVIPYDQRASEWERFLGQQFRSHTADVGGHDLLAGAVEYGPSRYFAFDHEFDGEDEFIPSLIAKHAHGSPTVVGGGGSDWAGFTVTPWKYFANARLGWHNDGAADNSRTVGAFVLYVHPEWSAEWSGDLLIHDQAGGAVRSTMIEPTDEDPIGRQILQAGDPYCVLARPARLVMFSADTYHTVRMVDPSAGERFRASYTGFFLKEEPRTR